MPLKEAFDPVAGPRGGATRKVAGGPEAAEGTRTGPGRPRIDGCRQPAAPSRCAHRHLSSLLRGRGRDGDSPSRVSRAYRSKHQKLTHTSKPQASVSLAMKGGFWVTLLGPASFSGLPKFSPNLGGSEAARPRLGPRSCAPASQGSQNLGAPRGSRRGR